MTSTKTNVIVDGMNIAFRCAFIYDQRQGLQNEAGDPTGTIYGFVRHMVKLRDRFPSATYYVAWEGLRSHEERQNIYAEYKATRKSSEPSEADGDASDDPRSTLYSQLEALQGLLTVMGIHQVKADGYEADDMIATLVRENLSGSDHKNIIVSSDRDLLQLVGDGTVMMTPHPEKFYDEFKVQEEYGVPPRLLLSYRTFDGDKSDNMPGMYRFPRKKIASIVNEHDGDLESIYTECEVRLTDFQSKTMTEFEEQAYINHQVMTLRTVDDYEELVGTHEKDTIEQFCDQLDFGSIRADLLSFSAETGFAKTGDTDVGILHSAARSTGTGE